MSSGEAPSAAMLTVFSERRSDLVITARETRAEGVVSLTLADPGGAQLPAWTPGAHIDLLLDDTVRQYSLCGTAGRPAHAGASRCCSTRAAGAAPARCTRR